MLHINIRTKPHNEQRYETVGDWVWDKKQKKLTIFISDMNDWKKEFLVAIHELTEVMLCKDRGITQEEVDNFDKEFESHRLEGNTDEPGDDPSAPYKNEHFVATNIERQLALELGVDWKLYEEAIYAL